MLIFLLPLTSIALHHFTVQRHVTIVDPIHDIHQVEYRVQM